MDEEDWKNDGHWALQQPAHHLEEPDNIPDDEVVAQDVIDMLPVHDGNSSITTTVSISDGALSNNVHVNGQPSNEEVNQIILQQNNIHDLGLGLNNIINAYPDDEEPELPVIAANEVLLVNEIIEEPQIAATPLVAVATAISNVAVHISVDAVVPDAVAIPVEVAV